MKILIVTATSKEIEPFRQALGEWIPVGDNLFRNSNKDKTIDMLVAGAGMVSTAFAMGQLAGKQEYDFAVNAGICGSFSRKFAIGEVLNVISDSFADMGAEDHDGWVAMSGLGLENRDALLSGNGTLKSNPGRFSSLLNHLRTVKGATVNTVHGNADSIRRFTARTDADIETMEGAAFMFACARSDTGFVQLRSVSNYVEPRDTEKWNIPLAVKNLNAELTRFVGGL